MRISNWGDDDGLKVEGLWAAIEEYEWATVVLPSGHRVSSRFQPDDGIDLCLCGAEWPCRESVQGRLISAIFGDMP